MSVELKCVVSAVEPSYIPNIFILSLECNKARIRMDIHKYVNIVDKGDKVLFTITKTLPRYEEGKDFVARGYVITKREVENGYKLLISLWGFLIVLETNDKSIADSFDYMDEIFVHMRKVE